MLMLFVWFVLVLFSGLVACLNFGWLWLFVLCFWFVLLVLYVLFSLDLRFCFVLALFVFLGWVCLMGCLLSWFGVCIACRFRGWLIWFVMLWVFWLLLLGFLVLLISVLFCGCVSGFGFVIAIRCLCLVAGGGVVLVYWLLQPVICVCFELVVRCW